MKITTRFELQALIDNCGGTLTLYTGSRSHRWSMKHTWVNPRIEPRRLDNLSEFIRCDEGLEFSLKDRHLGEPQDYNETYFFTTEEEAKEFARS